MNKLLVTFEDEEGTWVQTMSLMEIARMSWAAADKIIDFEIVTEGAL